MCDEKAVHVVYRLDRLGRTTIEVLRTVELVAECGGDIVALQMGVDTRTATGKLVLTVLAGVAEVERTFIQERVRAGLARRAGKQLGGKRELGVRSDGSSTGKTEPRPSPGRRLTEAERRQRAEVRRFLAKGLPSSKVARLAGCSEALVRKIRKLDEQPDRNADEGA